jgi:serine/threonine protein kinase
VLGERIGNFKIASQLGVGGMGEVYLGEHEKIGTRVAVKVLLPDISAHKEHVERFFNEAVAVSKIQHVGIGKIFDVGFHGARAYLVMEFLPGETLATRLKRVGRLSVSQVSEIGKQICNVLEAVHKAGIIHRDLKPENIFLVPDVEIGERVRIVDFGIAKLDGTGGAKTATNFGAMGTPAYMPPEQWMSSKSVDWRADAYALGCMTFEMLTGRQPFPFETFGEACAKHMNEAPPRASMFAPVPPQVDALILALMAKPPDQRPASMRDIANAFVGFVGGAGASQAMAPTVVPVPASQAPTVHASPGPRKTPRMMDAQPEPYTAPMMQPASQPNMVPVPPANPHLVPVSQFQPPQPKTANKKVVIAFLGIAVAGGATAVVLARRGGDKQDDPPKTETTTTTTTTSKNKWKTDEEPTTTTTTSTTTTDKSKTVGSGSGSSRPPPIPGLPVEVDSTLVSEAFRDLKPEIAKCKALNKTVIKITVVVNPDGTVASATLKDTPEVRESPDPALASCVIGHVKTAKFKKTQFGGTFDYPFLF